MSGYSVDIACVNDDGRSRLNPSSSMQCYLFWFEVASLAGGHMPQMKLTKTAIDALSTPQKDIVYWDTGCPGFGVKVTPKGRKVFVVLYRTAGAGSRLRKYTIGPYGRVTLNQARVTAQKVFAAKLDGRDLAAEKRSLRRRMVADRVDDLLEASFAQHIAQNRSALEMSRMLRREIGSAWGARSIHEISKRDVIDVVSAIEQRGAPVAANKALKAIKTFFRWCVGRAVLDRSPADGVPLPAKQVTRDRVLERWRTRPDHPRRETDRRPLWRHRRGLGLDRPAPRRGGALHLG